MVAVDWVSRKISGRECNSKTVFFLHPSRKYLLTRLNSFKKRMPWQLLQFCVDGGKYYYDNWIKPNTKRNWKNVFIAKSSAGANAAESIAWPLAAIKNSGSCVCMWPRKGRNKTRIIKVAWLRGDGERIFDNNLKVENPSAFMIYWRCKSFRPEKLPFNLRFRHRFGGDSVVLGWLLQKARFVRLQL